MQRTMVLDRLLGRKKKEEGQAVIRSEFLKIRPVRNPNLKSEKDETGKITLIISLEKPEEETERRRKRRKGIFSRMAPAPTEKRIQLDMVGSIVWELCDGERTAKDIIERLHKEYKVLPSEAEISLNAYFNQLSKRGLLGFILPEETRTRLQEKEKNEKEKK
ncbi:MAG: PqqD family protein [Candidatus Bathyarchaeota archaeon]|nr:PqqD family protein [Candidatus Bathyarchaeota archaeon]